MTVEARRPAPRDLLAAARRLLHEPAPALVGIWPRAAAMLARQALERQVERLWERRAPAVARSSQRAQLLCLRSYVGDASLCAKAEHAWGALARACHHHPYELPPTEGELLRLMQEVEEVIDGIEPRIA